MAEATKEKKPGRVAKFFRDYRCPFKSVKTSTAIVVAFTVILAAIIAVLDLGFSSGVIALGRLF